jgi:hypothetical protein
VFSRRRPAGGWRRAAPRRTPVRRAEWYAYFGASELAVAKRTGARWPDALTLALAAVFAGWAYYALAALGAARRPPLLRWGLAAIGGVCLLRGATLVPEVPALARGAIPLRYPVFSSSRSRSASRLASERGARGPPCAAGRRADESSQLPCGASCQAPTCRAVRAPHPDLDPWTSYGGCCLPVSDAQAGPHLTRPSDDGGAALSDGGASAIT